MTGNNARDVVLTQIIYSGLGGHGSVAFSLLSADDARTWRPSIIFLGVEPVAKDYLSICVRDAIPCQYVPVKARRSWEAWKEIFHSLSQEGPDAILLHNPTALLPCWCYARRYGARLVVVEHQANHLKKPLHYAISLLANWLADAVVVLTPEYRSELGRQLGWLYKDSKVFVIPNGIDTEIFAQTTGSAPKRKLIITLGMAGRFTSIKRHDRLVVMISELRAIRPDIGWHLTLAGGGESFDKVRQQIRDMGLGDAVTLTGTLGQSELRDWYRGLDIYVHASEGETLSTSILQAMSMGLPIVASDVPGISNIVQEHECGLVVDHDRADSFASAVLNLVDHPGLWGAVSANGRRAAMKHFSQKEMFKRYDQLIRSVSGIITS